MVGIIKRTFTQLDKQIFLCLYNTLVRPHLEYGNAVWCPFKMKDITALENVQRHATKLITSIHNLEYEERLKQLNLYTLAFRRQRYDMIEVYKILTGSYDCDASPYLYMLGETDTRGNGKKLYSVITGPIYRLSKMRKHYFTLRVTDKWNSLPRSVVFAENITSFKSKLDQFWDNSPLKFDFKAS